MSAPARILLLSDIHLSRARPYFHANWELMLREIAAMPKPDLVIVTGDLALDGPSREDDLAFARAQLDRLPAPWHAIPGNHDVGGNASDARGEHGVDDALRDAWLRHFAVDFWSFDIPGWRLIGLDSLICGSGMRGEAEQAAFLDNAIAGAETRRVAVFMHKPLCLQNVLETEVTTACWAPQTRELLQRHVREGRIQLVVSGHLHEARDRVVSGTRHLWLPGLAFVNDMACEWNPSRDGRRRVGFVTAVMEAAPVLTWHEPNALLNIDIGNWLRTGGIGLYKPLAGEDQPYPGLFPTR